MSEFEIERVVRIHFEEGICLEIGTDPDTGTSVEIRTNDPASKSYFGFERLTLAVYGVNYKTLAYAVADAVRHVADSLE